MKQNYRKPWRWSQGVQKAGLAALLFFGAVKGVDAQVSAYSFSQSSGTFTEVTGGTVLAAATGNSIGAPSLDSGTWGISLPFTFNFNGLNHTALNVSANGFVTFGTTTTTTSSPISGSEAYQGAISAFGRDLNTVFNVSGVTGDIRWETVGTAPNREVVIQWTNFRPTYSTSAAAAYVFSFQIRLQESTNQISTVYTQGAYLLGSTTYSSTAQIGLRGATNTDFNNRLNSTTELFANSSTGTANGSSQAFNTVNATPGMPSDGLTYTWTPPICIGSVGVLGSATTNTIPVTWTASPSAVSGYTIYYSTVNTAPTASTVLDATNSVAAGAAATSADITGLTASTTYYIWMRTECGATDVSGWVSLGSVTTACAPVAAPFLQEFSGGSLPGCWTNQNPVSSVANALWKFSGNADYGANLANNGRPAGSFAWVDASTPYDDIHNVELLTPNINLTGITAPYVSFDWFKNHSSSTSTTPVVPTYDDNMLKVDVNDGTGWVTIFSSATNAQEWRTQGILLPASYVGATIQLRFTVDKDVAGNGYFYDDVLLDNVEVKEAPTCLMPTQATVVNVIAGTADFSWMAPATAPANGYHLYYNTTGTAPDATTVLDATNSVAVPAGTTTATIPGLPANTTYYVWVRSNCGGTDVSDWVAFPSFTTPCSVFTAPWTYTVETGTATTNASIADCWSATPTATSSAFRWDLDDSGSTPSSSTGPSAAYSGTKYFYTEASSGSTGAVAELLSPLVDVTALTNPSIQFYYHMYGSTMGELHVDVYDGAAWNNDLFVLTGQQQTAAADAWRLAIVDLGSLTITGNIQVRFRALRGTDFYGDMAIDDIAFVEAPACIAPSGLTAATTPADATITWNASSSNPSSYDVYVDTTNTQPATPTYPGVTGTSQVIPGVSGTTYYVWVVANCATATAVAGPISYTIPFPPPANDECTGAITLTVNPDLSCGVVTQATTVSATQSTGVPNPTCGVLSGTDDDVWFKFTATGNAHRISLTSISGSSDRVMQLYSGACGSLVTVQCSDPETMDVTTLTPGQEYYVRVWTYATSATTSSTFNICVGTPPPPPANDDCAGAIALPGGVDFVSGAVTGTNVAATNSSQTAPSCQGSSGMDVWYTVTIPSSGNVTLETKAVTGSSYTDSVISAYTGDCTTGLTQIPGAAGCNDDDGDDAFSLLNVTGQTPGSVLYVRVSRYAATGSNAGEFQVSAYDPSFLGTSEVITDSKEVKVYPNPFTDIVNVSDIKDVKRVTVVDMAGRVVKTISDPARALQLGDLKSGMYILKLDYKDGTVKSAKVIKK